MAKANDHPELPSELNGPVAASGSKRGRSNRILRIGAIGCASLLGWVLLMVLLANLFGDDTPARSRPAVTQDTTAAQPSQDTVLLAAPPPAELAPPTIPPESIYFEAPPPPPPKPVKKEVTVYTTSTGTHYHRSGCSSLRKSKYPTPLSEARVYYEPCHRCNPPR